MFVKAMTFYFLAIIFFVLGGFMFSVVLNGKEIIKGIWGLFYNLRF